MDATQSGVHDYQFSVMSETPGNLLDYEIKLSDEALLAPMGVFFPSSFCLPDNRHLMAGETTSSPHSGSSTEILATWCDDPLQIASLQVNQP